MAAVYRALWRTSRTFSCSYNKKLLFNPKLKGIRTCFRAPGSAEEESFEEMFRNSDFVKMGRPQGKLIAGKITHIVEHEDTMDMYVDFGWKFHAVFTRGKEQGSHYKVDDLVKIKLKALEATGHFLGQNKRVTLCEADGDLEGKIDPDVTHGVFEKELSADKTHSASLDFSTSFPREMVE